MPPEIPPDEEDYASSEDSDFAPDEAADREQSEASEDEGGDTEKLAAAATAAAAKRKRAAGDDEAEDAGFENSGDEAIIEKGKKRRKKDKAAAIRDDDDEGGEGGLIKTRSMRAAEKEEKKARVASGPVTVDVDALWAQMTAGPIVPSNAEQEKADGQAPADGEPGQKASQDTGHDRQDGETSKDKGKESGEMIKIKRTYNFAGKVHTEEKMVARDSAEAKLYLASIGENAEPEADDEPQRRMPRKAFRSAFEPIIDHSNQRTDLNLGMTVRLKARELAKEAKKLNVVEKSKMDWAGFVDKEGIKDELALAGKSKDSYTARQDFLARSEARREEDARRARLAGKV